MRLRCFEPGYTQGEMASPLNFIKRLKKNYFRFFSDYPRCLKESTSFQTHTVNSALAQYPKPDYSTPNKENYTNILDGQRCRKKIFTKLNPVMHKRSRVVIKGDLTQQMQPTPAAEWRMELPTFSTAREKHGLEFGSPNGERNTYPS